MHTIRRISLAALALAFAHLVFGGIVRISGSGMGCGDHWPKCHGQWFPPLDRPDLIIELTHRYLAVLLGVVVAAMCLAAWSRRNERDVGGAGGVLRAAVGSLALVGVNGLFGGLTVRYGNPWWATVPHWVLAMAAVAAIASTVIRAGGLGGAGSRARTASPRTRRAALAAVALAFGAVAMGGVTAKYESAAVACPSFPHCGSNPNAAPGAAHIQLTHRTLAFLLALHLLGVAIALPRRGEGAVVTRAALVAFGLTAAQIAIAGAMIGLGLPALPRALHQLVGVGIWVSTFVFYYLARRSARTVPVRGTPSLSAADVAVPATERA